LGAKALFNLISNQFNAYLIKKSSLKPLCLLIFFIISGPYSVIFTWTFFPSISYKDTKILLVMSATHNYSFYL